jgi:hypothetical protein
MYVLKALALASSDRDLVSLLAQRVFEREPTLLNFECQIRLETALHAGG